MIAIPRPLLTIESRRHRRTGPEGGDPEVGPPLDDLTGGTGTDLPYFPTPDHFRFVESPVPAPLPGTALVENLCWSVDPYHREMMDGDFELNAPLEGRSSAGSSPRANPRCPRARSSSTAGAGGPTRW